MARTFSIRKAAVRDGGGILQCLRRAFAPYQASYTSDAFGDTVLTGETIRQRFSEMSVLVAVDQSSHVIGTIAYKVGEGRIWSSTEAVRQRRIRFAQNALQGHDARHGLCAGRSPSTRRMVFVRLEK
jgi:hypothetical protein